MIGKNENLYAREYVEYYKKIGYNKIFIYDNNQENGEKFEDVINDYIHNGFVKIIDYRGRIKKNTQIDAYIDCYKRNNKIYDWLSFYDMDEFLELNKKYSSIQEFLKDKIFEKCKNIKINWLMYRNNILYYENKSLHERMRTFNYNDSDNKHVKSTVKGNLSVNYWEKSWNPHTSTLNVISCSSSGKIIQFDSPFNYPPDFLNAKLKHYYYKSFEEYCLKKKRGRADLSKMVNNEEIKNIYNRLYMENINDKEKMIIINKIFTSKII